MKIISYEIHNLLLILVTCILVIWIIKFFKSIFDLSELSISIRREANMINVINFFFSNFKILKISNYSRLVSEIGERGMGTYLKALIRGTIDSPVIDINKITNPIHLDKNSIKLNDLKNGIEFNFDTLVNSSIQLYYGVNKLNFFDKIIKLKQLMMMN